jgi:hypothetical protein
MRGRCRDNRGRIGARTSFDVVTLSLCADRTENREIDSASHAEDASSGHLEKTCNN